jgi:protein-L-isoaspartate O-methyltransferase
MRLLDQLKDGGRLVVVRSNGTVGEATRWYRDGGHFGEQPLFDATLPALASFARSPQFVF